MVALAPTPKIKNLDKLLMHCQRRRYQAKSNIICAGDQSDTLFFIIKGSVTILIEDDDGREMIIAYLNAGDFSASWACSNRPGMSSNAAPGYAPRSNAKSRRSAMRNSVSCLNRTRTFCMC